jgi:hypothetical protein
LIAFDSGAFSVAAFSPEAFAFGGEATTAPVARAGGWYNGVFVVPDIVGRVSLARDEQDIMDMLSIITASGLLNHGAINKKLH